MKIKYGVIAWLQDHVYANGVGRDLCTFFWKTVWMTVLSPLLLLTYSHFFWTRIFQDARKHRIRGAINIPPMFVKVGIGIAIIIGHSILTAMGNSFLDIREESFMLWADSAFEYWLVGLGVIVIMLSGIALIVGLAVYSVIAFMYVRDKLVHVRDKLGIESHSELYALINKLRNIKERLCLVIEWEKGKNTTTKNKV